MVVVTKVTDSGFVQPPFEQEVMVTTFVLYLVDKIVSAAAVANKRAQGSIASECGWCWGETFEARLCHLYTFQVEAVVAKRCFKSRFLKHPWSNERSIWWLQNISIQCGASETSLCSSMRRSNMGFCTHLCQDVFYLGRFWNIHRLGCLARKRRFVDQWSHWIACKYVIACLRIPGVVAANDVGWRSWPEEDRESKWKRQSLNERERGVVEVFFP